MAAVPLPTMNNDDNTRSRPPKLAITSMSAASSPASAASPISSASTPTSTHQLAMKPAAPGTMSAKIPTLAVTGAMASKSSITSKEWVIPPRPKPGRKPATDTPPTKRKAQNRAAQRAFRERRAARVGELEEQLDEIQDEHERQQEGLRQQVQNLDAEVQSLRSRCVTLEDMLEKERTERSKMANELESFRRRWRDEGSSISSRNGSHSSHQGRAPGSIGMAAQLQQPRGSLASNTSEYRNSTTAFSISQIISPPDTSSMSGHLQQSSADTTGCGNCKADGPCACVDDVLAAGCGKCSLGTRCECLEAALGGAAINSEVDLKRRPSSISALAPDEKRQKSDPYPNEIDFTSMFSSKKKDITTEPPIYQPVTQQAIPPRDSCGFCTEGTYCMCAEAAASQTLAPMGSQVQTPPPSENDVGPPPMEVTSTGAIKLPSINSLNRTPIQPVRKPGGCGPNGPGTCTQCLGDAKSGLFCRSLAANFARGETQPSGGCCGGSGVSGCCKSTNPTGPPPTNAPPLGLSLSCADAYKTLSSHRNFDRAADEIGMWLPKLRAVPKEANPAARLPIEVETASIMGVLKEFDVRFGREA
ncbi:Uu.00g006790.m01.CDS01 [Anthostomella pinea]|uniref:Uu.00g006790.m01.CDS01 n=1 Tax=Anthostomella pinea TaxID=933095 RepID=A0AAI8VKC4_9PEZI|nr:Uu.00g006790.m01.CDS01 [Anthostomella pinea]